MNIRLKYFSFGVLVALLLCPVIYFNRNPINSLLGRVRKYDISRIDLPENFEDEPGSTLIEISNGQANLRLQVERSEDMSTWTKHENDVISIPMTMDEDKQYFRFSIPQE